MEIWNRNHYWLSKLDFRVSSTTLILYPLSLSPSSLEKGCFSVVLAKQKFWKAWSFCLKFWSYYKTFLQTSWQTQILIEVSFLWGWSVSL